MSKLKLILPVVVLMAGCSQHLRFQQEKDDPRMAFDTKTGQRCLTGPKPIGADPPATLPADFFNQQQKPTGTDPWDKAFPQSKQTAPVPYCVDLSK